MKKSTAKKAISLLLALVMGLSLVACGGTPSKSSGAPAGKVKDRLVIGATTTMAQYDPIANNGLVDGQIREMTHNTLIGVEWDSGKVIPELAEKMEQPDDVTYIFHLRKGVKFHNGETLTARDVVFTFDRAKESSYQKSRFGGVKSYEATDDYTVKIVLTAPDVEYVTQVAQPYLSIVNEKAVTADPDKGPGVGTGAYKITDYLPGDYLLLTRFDDYWGEKPQSKEIMYRAFSEPSARVIALQTGEVDICTDVPGIEAEHVSSHKDCDLLQLPSTKLVYLALNTSGYNKDLTNLKVRQALICATNTEEIILSTKEGYASPQKGVIPFTMWGYSDSVNVLTYDVEKAKSLLAEAGYKNGLDITIACRKATFPGLFTVLQQQWKKAGINLTLQTDDSTVYSTLNKEGTFDIAACNNSLSATGYGMKTLWYSNSGSNVARVKDEKIDKMLEEGLTIQDTAKRLAYYAELSQVLADTSAQIPLYIDMLLIGQGKTVTGATYYGCGKHVFTYAYATEKN